MSRWARLYEVVDSDESVGWRYTVQKAYRSESAYRCAMQLYKAAHKRYRGRRTVFKRGRQVFFDPERGNSGKVLDLNEALR